MIQHHQKELKSISTKNKVILFPSHVNLALCTPTNYSLGSQDVTKYKSGAYTGEISAEQLKSYNVEYCLVGHSERRQLLNETNLDINLKIKNLLKNNIIPVLCIGETKEERQTEKVKEVLQKEILESTSGLTEIEKKNIIIAYEPIWSVGTGIIPTIDQIEEVFLLIKQYYPENKILYGGSVNENSINELKQSNLIDGYLIGGLSLDPKRLEIMLNNLNN